MRFEWYHRLGFPDGSISESVQGREESRIGQRDKESCNTILVGASANYTGNSETDCAFETVGA